MNDKTSDEINPLEGLLDLSTVTDAADAHSRGITVAAKHSGPAQALDLFAWAHLSEPDNVLYATDYALALLECGRDTEARQVALVVDAQTHSMDCDDFSSSELCRIAVVLSTVVDAPYRALPFFESACENEPTDMELLLNYGISLKNCGYEDEAAAVAEKVVSVLETNEDLASSEAVILSGGAHLLSRTDPVRATSAVQKALRIASDNFEVHNAAGWIGTRNDDHENAANHFRRAIEIEPQSPKSHCGLQYALFSMGMFEDALSQGESILKTWPDLVEVRFNIASAALHMGWHKEAEQGFLDIISSSPEDAVTLAALGLSYAIRGWESEARKQQAEALDLGGDDPEVQKISKQIDRILDSGKGPTDEELTSLLLAVFATMLKKRRSLAI